MLEKLMEPFQYEFIRLGMLAALMSSLACASLGVYVVFRRMAFLGDAVAHAALPGMAVAFLLKLNLALGALGAALLTVMGVGSLIRRQEVSEDSAIGIVFTGMFAAGIIIMNVQKNQSDLSHMLFGNLLGVTGTDVLLMTGVACLTVLCLAVFAKELFLTTCDPVYSETIGLNPSRLKYILLLLLALAIVAGILSLGVVLTSALLITPAATARLVSDRVVPMMLISVGTAFAACILGIYISFYFSVSSGAAIVAVATLFFIAAWGIKAFPRGHNIQS